ncbi:MAG TPA: DDE-type integrase/transposase/recombinase [Clostridia bacterium]|nr:DDE-type integrase/transposase/recombinase [Clostridia bacterium]
MMDENLMKEVALFRFSLIAPIVSETYREVSKMEYFRNVANKEYMLPNQKKASFSPLTIKKWYLKYTKGGLDALIPHARIDLGHTRALTTQVCKKIEEYKAQFPYITGKKIYQKLIENNHLKEMDASIDTVYRYLKSQHLTRDCMPPQECLAFEMEFANDCWQADTTVGPVIVVNSHKKQTYLIDFIDDASRILVHGEFFFADNAINMQTVFKKAIMKYGIPKRLFVDNGCSYQNNQLNWICAELGIVKIHSKPYYPQGKAKIERSHRTVKDKWMHAIDWNAYHSLEELNKDFDKFLADEYTNIIHSSLGMTPKERYLKDFDRIKFLEPEVLEERFLHRITRKVTPTATISLFNTIYEVPQQYIGRNINLRFYPENMEEVYLYEDLSGKRLHVCYPLKKIDNSKRKRKANINYNQMDGGSKHV